MRKSATTERVEARDAAQYRLSVFGVRLGTWRCVHPALCWPRAFPAALVSNL